MNLIELLYVLAASAVAALTLAWAIKGHGPLWSCTSALLAFGGCVFVPDFIISLIAGFIDFGCRGRTRKDD